MKHARPDDLDRIGQIPAASIDLEPFLMAQQAAMRAVAQTQTHLLAHALDTNRALMELMERRFEADRETVREMASCANPAEAMALWSGVTRRLMKDWVTGYGTLAGLYASQTRATLTDVQTKLAEAATAGAGGTGGTGNARRRGAARA